MVREIGVVAVVCPFSLLVVRKSVVDLGVFQNVTILIERDYPPHLYRNSRICSLATSKVFWQYPLCTITRET